MTDEELSAIRERTEEATSGPWQARGLWGEELYAGDRQLASFTSGGNGPFCAAARQDIPALLAEVERLRALIARYRQQLDFYAGDGPPA